MSAETNPRKRTVRIEVGADARSYVSDGQRVTLVPLTIKRRQNRKLLIPPAPDAATAAGGFDVPMIKTLGKAFYWKRLIDEGVYEQLTGDLTGVNYSSIRAGCWSSGDAARWCSTACWCTSCAVRCGRPG